MFNVNDLMWKLTKFDIKAIYKAITDYHEIAKICKDDLPTFF